MAHCDKNSKPNQLMFFATTIAVDSEYQIETTNARRCQNTEVLNHNALRTNDNHRALKR